MTASIEQRVDWQFIRYANCWEDAAILVPALQPAPGKRILSIASGGDNCFALLAQGADVVAADLNPSQLACVSLKAAAIRNLDRTAYLAFLGISPSPDRLAVYGQLKSELPQEARAFWDAHREVLQAGLVHAGKFERYFQMFRTRILPWVHSRRTVLSMLEQRTHDERIAFYDSKWDNLRWQLLFRIFFSRFFMGRLGRDPEFFRYVEGSVAERILSRTRYAMTELSTHDNPFLDYILGGNFTRAVPRYLEEDAYAALQENIGRLTLHLGPIEEAGEKHRGSGFDGFNLSDIFEYLDPAISESIYRRLLGVSNPGARFAYWNMLVPRKAPAALADQVAPLTSLAEELFRRDRAFFYSAFVVEERQP